jgi:hypothetical protein
MLAALLSAALVAAASDSRPTLSLSPAVVLARGHFGQSLTQTITLTNQTGTTFGFEMLAQDVVVRKGKRVFIPAGEAPHSIAQSAVFSLRSGEVKPFSSVSVDVRVTVPATTDIRAVVAIFRGTTAYVPQGSSVGLTASLGALITFNLTNDTRLEAGLVRVVRASASTNLSVEQSLANVGTEPVVPQGVAAILDSRGVLVGKMSFLPQRLLPGERLTFAAEYPGRLAPGTYRVLCSFQYEGKDLTSAGTFSVR